MFIIREYLGSSGVLVRSVLFHLFSFLHCIMCLCCVCLRLVCPVLKVSLDFPFLIATFDFLKHLFIHVISKSGADPGFQVGGAHFKKWRRAEGGAKNVGVFRVKNHDFTPKNHMEPPLQIHMIKNTKR